MSVITLGDLTFEGFEVPGHIKFGGAQQLSVHKMLGGTRVIDVLGRDDAALSWSGILSGAEAADRARSLDARRASGISQTLSWDAFCYSVVIEDLELDFCNPWWIPYRIKCLVARDLAQSDIQASQSAISIVIADLTSAMSVLNPDMSALVAKLSSLVSAGPSGWEQSKIEVATGTNILNEMVAMLDVGLDSSDLGQLTTSAGSISALCYARGFLERSSMNINHLVF